MRTNVELDSELLAEAMQRTGLKTKRAVLDEALRTLVRFKRQADLRQLWGIGWEGDLDAMRRD